MSGAGHVRGRKTMTSEGSISDSWAKIKIPIEAGEQPT